MKITRELIDNGQKIIHVNYEKKDIERVKKLAEERKKAYKEKADAAK